MQKTKMSQYEKGWIEAMIDGKGSISLLKESRPHFKAGCTYKPRLNIGNKSKPLLFFAKEIIGGGAVILSPRGVNALDVSSNTLRWLLPQIQLIVKEKQRRLLLQALRILSRRVTRNKPRTDKELTALEGVYRGIRNANGRYP